MDVLVRMEVFTAVPPGSPPPGVVDEHTVLAPVEAVITPAPRPKESSERHAKAETNRTANKKSGSRREENNSRVIVRHHDEAGIYRHDGDVRSAANDNLA